MFQRLGTAAYKKDLTNTIRLCEVLGNPHHQFKSIHVAGTNGKGSTSHMLASVLQSAGYKTGLYTSPHLKEFTERIRINGQEISQEFVMNFVNKVQSAIDDIKPSFFEITVAMAFDYFAQQHVDIAVIEVGLGGRLDSTNVIAPILSVITNIGWDHKEILGDTLEKIATEKAGIIKPGIPVVVSHRQPGLDTVFQHQADACGARLYFADDDFLATPHIKNGITFFEILKSGKPYINQIQLSLQGLYQRYNLPGVLTSIELMRKAGFFISDDAMRKGLENVATQTGLKGRWQKLGEHPLIICDTGHNIDGITEVINQISTLSYRNLHMIIGMVKDKDITGILSLLPREASYYFCAANIPRALPADDLAKAASEHGLKGKVISDVNVALAEAKRNAAPNDLIFIGGSTFVVAEIEDL